MALPAPRRQDSASPAPWAWQDHVARFRRASTARATFQLGNTLIPLAGLFTLMYLSLEVSYWLTLALAPIAAGFYMRTFIIMHDCAHGSFLKSRRANEVIGFITGVLTLFSFASWRREHALHHASSGDLDRRGHGDIDTLTVSEYLALSRFARLKYRVWRNPAVMLLIGPVFLFIVNRLPYKGASDKRVHAWETHAGNLAILVIGVVLSLTIGLGAALMIYLPVYFIAGMAGVWLFYVQHQFEGTYWQRHEEWDYATAAMSGSSYYRLPRPLEWITGSIGLHHIHHLDPRIPNYHLRRCHESSPEFQKVPELTIWKSLRSIRLRLWDEEEQKLVGFAAARRRMRRLVSRPTA